MARKHGLVQHHESHFVEQSPVEPRADHSGYFPNTEYLGKDEMRVIILGSGMPNARKSQASASVMVELGNGDTSASNVRVVELVQDEQGDFEVQQPPDELPDHKTTLLSFHGGRFFAAAYKIGDLLPSAVKAQRAVAIIRLRGKDSIGSTCIQIMERYSAALQKNGGKLMFSGVSENVYDQLEKTEMIELLGEENVFPDSSKLLYSSKQALKAASAWLESAESEIDEGTESQK